MSHIFLKIKLATLAAQARIVRKLEQKNLRTARAWEAGNRIAVVPLVDAPSHARGMWYVLQHDRRHAGRADRRAHHLAYGFLRGTPYYHMEERTYLYPKFDHVYAVAEAHSDDDPRLLKQRFEEWVQAAIARIRETSAACIPDWAYPVAYQLGTVVRDNPRA